MKTSVTKYDYISKNIDDSTKGLFDDLALSRGRLVTI